MSSAVPLVRGTVCDVSAKFTFVLLSQGTGGGGGAASFPHQNDLSFTLRPKQANMKAQDMQVCSIQNRSQGDAGSQKQQDDQSSPTFLGRKDKDVPRPNVNPCSSKCSN